MNTMRAFFSQNLDTFFHFSKIMKKGRRDLLPSPMLVAPLKPSCIQNINT